MRKDISFSGTPFCVDDCRHCAKFMRSMNWVSLNQSQRKNVSAISMRDDRMTPTLLHPVCGFYIFPLPYASSHQNACPLAWLSLLCLHIVQMQPCPASDLPCSNNDKYCGFSIAVTAVPGGHSKCSSLLFTSKTWCGFIPLREGFQQAAVTVVNLPPSRLNPSLLFQQSLTLTTPLLLCQPFVRASWLLWAILVPAIVLEKTILNGGLQLGTPSHYLLLV